MSAKSILKERNQLRQDLLVTRDEIVSLQRQLARYKSFEEGPFASAPTPETPTLIAAEWTRLANRYSRFAAEWENSDPSDPTRLSHIRELSGIAHACRTMATLASAPADAVTVERLVALAAQCQRDYDTAPIGHHVCASGEQCQACVADDQATEFRDLAAACREALVARRHRAYLDSDAAVEKDTQFAWVIENALAQPGRTEYYCALHPAWDTDHMRAVRFARMEDAQAVLMALPNGWHLIGHAVEHGWSLVALRQGAATTDTEG